MLCSIKIGESIGTCVGCIEKCCQGLKAMADVKYNKYNGECANLPAPRKGGICSNCGNGICDNKNNKSFISEIKPVFNK